MSLHPAVLAPVPDLWGWRKWLPGSDFLWGLCRQKGHDIFLRAAFKAHEL